MEDRGRAVVDNSSTDEVTEVTQQVMGHLDVVLTYSLKEPRRNGVTEEDTVNPGVEITTWITQRIIV
jgi:hypothetical protein